MEQINFSFGSGGMACSFSEKELSEFIFFLRDNSPKPLPQLKAAFLIGRQEKSQVWVLNNKLQIDKKGNEIKPEESGYILLNESLVQDCKVLSSDIQTRILMPLSTEPLNKIVQFLQVTKHNALSSLLTLSGVIMAFHYETILSIWSGSPIVVAVGPSETGKSTAITIGLSMIGVAETAKYVSGSTSFFLERCGASTLPFGVDDPPKPNSKALLNPADIIISVYNGSKTANMKSNITPHSCPIFASNFNISSDQR